MRTQQNTINILITLLALGLPSMGLAEIVGGDYPQPATVTQQKTVNGAPTSGQSQGGSTVSNKTGNSPSQPATVNNAVTRILQPPPTAITAANRTPEPMTEEDTLGLILDDSINAYPEPCACPYSRNSDGFECGVEAAYYKPGGFRILCYPEDVRGQLYIYYRKTH